MSARDEAMAWAAEQGFTPEELRRDCVVIGRALGWLECAEDWDLSEDHRAAVIHKARMVLEAHCAAHRQHIEQLGQRIGALIERPQP